MTLFVRQSTAVTLAIGPFVDSGDGVTAETGLTLSQADVRLSKNGGAFAQKNNAATATHMESGYYSIDFSTTDTNTLGVLKIAIQESGALPLWVDCMVVPANVWDSLFGADQLQVHVNEMTAGIITAAVIATDAIDADAVADGAITSGVFAAGAITASAIAADAIGASELAADAVAEIVDAVWDEALTEPSGVFAWAGSFRNALNWLAALSRNKMTQTDTTSTLRNDADNADIATSTVSDNGTTTTRGEWT